MPRFRFADSAAATFRLGHRQSPLQAFRSGHRQSPLQAFRSGHRQSHLQNLQRTEHIILAKAYIQASAHLII